MILFLLAQKHRCIWILTGGLWSALHLTSRLLWLMYEWCEAALSDDIDLYLLLFLTFAGAQRSNKTSSNAEFDPKWNSTALATVTHTPVRFQRARLRRRIVCHHFNAETTKLSYSVREENEKHIAWATVQQTQAQLDSHALGGSVRNQITNWNEQTHSGCTSDWLLLQCSAWNSDHVKMNNWLWDRQAGEWSTSYSQRNSLHIPALVQERKEMV